MLHHFQQQHKSVMLQTIWSDSNQGVIAPCSNIVLLSWFCINAEWANLKNYPHLEVL